MAYQNHNEGYHRKLEAIIELADRWQIQIDGNKWPELHNLLEIFSNFARDYINLLKRIPAEIDHPQFAVNRGIDKLLNEWSALSRACEQRFENVGSPPQNDGLPGNLKGATRKLQEYCNRWNGTRVYPPYLRLTHPVVYFEKFYGLARSVYAPNSPVISIPLTDYNPGYVFSEDEDDELRWPALAHEFGHHIYWNALDLENAEAMRTAMRDNMIEVVITVKTQEKTKGVQRIQQSQRTVERVRLWSQWLEEVFADVCGTLLDGPTYALSAQDIVIEQVRQVDDLIRGDHEHPSPYLRPLIALQVLRNMAAESQSDDFRNALAGEHGIIAQLEKRWHIFCGDIDQKYYPDTIVTLKDLKDDIVPVVDTILTSLYWPRTNQTMLKRLEFYGQQTMPPDLRGFKDLKDLTSLQERVDESKGVVPIAIRQPSAPTNDDMPETLKATWLHLKSTVSNTEQDALTLWSLLLSLKLSDVHFHNSNHSCNWHWIYWTCHTHDPNTGEPIDGCSC